LCLQLSLDTDLTLQPPVLCINTSMLTQTACGCFRPAYTVREYSDVVIHGHSVLRRAIRRCHVMFGPQNVRTSDGPEHNTDDHVSTATAVSVTKHALPVPSTCYLIPLWPDLPNEHGCIGAVGKSGSLIRTRCTAVLLPPRRCDRYMTVMPTDISSTASL